MADDSSVSITISGTVDPSVAASAKAAKASVADLGAAVQVSSKVMAEALAQAGGDLSRVTPQMLGLGEAVQATAASTGELAGAQIAASQAITMETAVVRANTAAHVSNRAATEGMVIAHELLSGRFSRVAGSAMIMSQALSASAGEASIAAFALNPLTLGVAAVTAGIGYLIYKEAEQQEVAQASAMAFRLSGQAAMGSADGIGAYVSALADVPGVSREAAQSLVDFDGAHAAVSSTIKNLTNQLIGPYSQAFKKDAPEAVNKLKEALADLENSSLRDSIEKFDALNVSTLNLGPGQVAAIHNMLEMGRNTEATTAIIEALAQRAGVSLVTVQDQIKQTSTDLQAAKVDLTDLKNESASAFDPSEPEAYAMAVSDAAKRVGELEGQLANLKAGAAAGGSSLTSEIRDSDATLDGLKDNATRAKDAVAAFRKQMSDRAAAPGGMSDPKVQQYFADPQKYDKRLEQQYDPGDFHKPKAPKRDNPVHDDDAELQQVKAWQAVADVVAGIQTNMTQTEISFWSKKAQAATRGSKEWTHAVLSLSAATDRQNEDQARSIEESVNSEIEQHRKGAEAAKQTADEQVRVITEGVDREIEEHRRLVEATKAAAEQTKKAWHDANAEIMGAESQFISGAIAGRQSLGQLLESIALQTAEREIEADIQSWTERRLLAAEGQAAEAATARGGLLVQLLAEHQKAEAAAASSATQVATKAAAAGQTVAISKATGMQEQLVNAEVAAGGAYKAMAGIPIIGPELGAVAAAATFAGVMALGSFAKGMDYVPGDMVAQIHQGERIVPAADNAAMMSMMRAGIGRGEGGRGGDTHIHWNPAYHEAASPKESAWHSRRDFVKMTSKLTRRGVKAFR